MKEYNPDIYRLEECGMVSMDIEDYNAFEKALLEDLPELCMDWVKGTFYLGEYRSEHPDSTGNIDSLCINLKTGRWHDIAKNAQGENPITYYAHIHNVSRAEAIDSLYTHLDFRYQIAGDKRILI
ncbi:hypothetical protein [Loktanella salsilacus]|jgi:hypothetical protein|uniref:hypothetical protein n=2 Tax=Roseobacteraceae TaxID=2854170 RepID=UPI00370416EC